MRACQQCGGVLPRYRRKFCTDECYAVHRVGYQRDYRLTYTRPRPPQRRTPQTADYYRAWRARRPQVSRWQAFRRVLRKHGAIP